MSMLALLLVFGGPAGAPTDESVLYDDAPAVQPEPHEEQPAIEVPAPALSPEPATELAPAPEPELEPPPTFTPPKLALPPPPPPPTGAGRLVGGSFAIALGLGAASALIIEGSRAGGNPQFAATTFIPLGLAGIGVGTYLLVRGAKARSNFNEWRAYTSRPALPTGEGLIVAGTISTVVGGVTLVAASVQARDPTAMDRPLTPTLFAVGATGVGFGVGALTWGLLRRGKYISWRQSNFLSTVRPTMAPVLGPDFALHGASFGLAGRL
jgi:hypothetical protein